MAACANPPLSLLPFLPGGVSCPARRAQCIVGSSRTLRDRMPMASPFVVALRAALELVAASPVEPGEAVIARRAVRELEHALGRLEGRETSETDLTAIVCHDLKDPLASIVMGAGFLRKTVAVDDAPARRVVEAILRSTDRMGQVIGDFHDLARLEAGRIGLDLRAWDVVPILRAALASFDSRARAGESYSSSKSPRRRSWRSAIGLACFRSCRSSSATRSSSRTPRDASWCARRRGMAAFESSCRIPAGASPPIGYRASSIMRSTRVVPRAMVPVSASRSRKVCWACSEARSTSRARSIRGASSPSRSRARRRAPPALLMTVCRRDRAATRCA